MSPVFTAAGTLDTIRLAGKVVQGNVTEAVTTAVLDASTSMTTQLTLTLADPDVKLLNSGLFTLGTPASYGRLPLTVAAIATPYQGLTVTLRSGGVTAMRHTYAGMVRRNITPGAFVRADAHAAGLAFFGEPGAERKTITRVWYSGGTHESAWDVAQRLATECGYLCFEFAGTVYFGRPSWLVRHLPKIGVEWDPTGLGAPPWLLTQPDMRASVDDTAGKTGSFTISPENLPYFGPGVGVLLNGMGSFNGPYLVSQITGDLASDIPPTISIVAPIDPAATDKFGTQAGGVQPGSKTKSKTAHPAAKRATKGGLKKVYPNVTTGPVSIHGASYPTDGQVRGSTTTGVTIYAPYAEAVLAPADGTITRVSKSGTPLHTVTLYVGLGISITIGHVVGVSVAAGHRVARGQRIGLVGEGASKGYVRVEVYVAGRRVDPLTVLPPV